jgi:predicted RND superfamily exporter protein
VSGDPSDPAVGPIAAALAKAVAWICARRARAGAVVLASLLLAFLGLWFGLSIRVDTDLRALLPPTAPSVAALDELEARKGSAEDLILAIEAPTAADADAMARGLAREVQSWPETLEVSVVRDYTPLRDHALYLLELEDLERLHDALEAERKRAVARATRLDLGGGGGGGEIDVEAVIAGESWDDPGYGELDWGTQGAGSAKTEPKPEPDANERADGPELEVFLDEQRVALLERGVLSADEVELIWPEENERGEIPWREQVGQPYETREGRVRTIRASLSIPATDVEFARELLARVERRAAALREGEVDEATRAEVVAAYNVSDAVNTILDDARRATWISAALVLAVLLLGFRRIRALILVAVPMAVALGLTLAIAKLIYGELNALTVFLFAVLFGMGVDFSVHLFALRERQGPVADWPALVREHLRPLAATMATTAACLAVLALAKFTAFREFGMISAIGVVLCFVAALALVPATDVLLGPLAPRRNPARSLVRRPTSSGEVPRRPWPRELALALLAGLAIYGAPKLELEKNTRELNRSDAASSASREKPIPYGSTGGRRKTLVLVADDPAQLDLAVERLRELQASGELLPGGVETLDRPRRPWVDEVYGLRTLMPVNQQRKAELLAEIGARTNDFLAELPDLDEEARRYRTHLEALERLAQAAPLRVEELPDWALEPFREHDGRSDRIAHVELNIAGHHIDELVALRHRLDGLLADTGVRAADSRLVFADLMVLVEQDARRLPIYALLVILVFIAVDLRRVGPTLACFSTFALGLGVVVGLMGLWPLKLNFFNLVVMPAVVGLGIDASIHLWHARTKPSLAATGRASLIAASTTVAGFSGLLAADHAGLRSIGELGVMAIIVCVGVAFLALYPARTNPTARTARARMTTRDS